MSYTEDYTRLKQSQFMFAVAYSGEGHPTHPLMNIETYPEDRKSVV